MRLAKWTWLGLALLAGSCGGDDGPAAVFTLQINSRDVVLNAVDRVDIVVEPRPLDRRFEMVPEMSHMGGEITTRVSARGEYIIQISRDWVHAHAEMPNPMQVFILRVPLEADPEPDRSVIDDPVVRVELIRNRGTEERIARGSARLVWPLPDGGRSIVTVQCIRDGPTDFSRQCRNEDGIDAGQMMDPDAGTPADGG